jgi:hypothetical protein
VGTSTQRQLRALLFAAAIAWLALGYIHCGAASDLGTVQPKNLCNCLPVEPDIADYRHAAKHVAIPSMTPQEITVATMLGWDQGLPALPPDAPRSGRELQVFHIAKAYVQSIALNGGDCDVVVEVSDVPDKTALRVIVETPVDSEYCSARTNLQTQLSQHGFQFDNQHGGELPQALPAEILGMAFEDFEHDRGSAQVATLWELHPATVTLLP